MAVFSNRMIRPSVWYLFSSDCVALRGFTGGMRCKFGLALRTHWLNLPQFPMAA